MNARYWSALYDSSIPTRLGPYAVIGDLFAGCWFLPPEEIEWPI